MRKSILRFSSAILLLLITCTAHAQIMSGNGFFKGTFVEAGIQPSGAFGSLVSAPTDYVSATVSKYSGRVGFIADVGKDGWTVGSPKYIGDFFVPGTPYEAFSVKMNGTLYENAGSAAATIPGTVTGFSNDGTTASIEWTGTKNNLQIRQVTSVGKNSSFILIRVYIKNTGSSAINNVFYTRSVDPDNEVDQVGAAAYTTINKVESQNPNGTSTALVSGKGQTYGSYLGLGSRDCRARVAVMGSFSSDGESIFNGTGLVALSAQGTTNTADDAIAVSFKLGNIAAGDSTSLAMAYVLNAADLPPAMDETDPLFNVKADTYGSGSVVNVCSGSQATLNIVNGDGYTWTWSPATGLDQTTGRSVKASLTEDITYTASGTNTCGTTRSIALNLHPVVSTAPDAAGTITGLSTVYKGWNATYSVPAIAHATNYKWTIPSGASFVSGYGTNSIVIKFGTTAASGSVSVYGENSCGTGDASTFPVTLNSGASSLVISSGNASVANSAAFASTFVVDNKITIAGTDNITNTRVYMDGGFQTGDKLVYDSLLPSGVSSAFTASTGALTFTGTASPAEWQAIFRAVKFTSTASNVADRSVKFVLGDMVSLTIGGKPHYYEYIKPSVNPSWAEANAAAANRTFFGLAGYLATSTSLTENDFIKQKLSTDGWMGASDDYNQVNLVKGTTYTLQSQTEGNWLWVNGPEAGTAISTGNGSPVVATGGFMYWSTGEPNNTGSNENYMQFYSSNNGKWNDLEGIATASVPGYVVEYGGYSSDPAISIEYTRTLKNVSDNTPPVKPAKPVMTDGDGKNTNNPRPTIKGTTEANAVVKIYNGSTLVTSVTADGTGKWSYTFTTDLADGEYNITNTATDAAGNTSAASDALTIDIDTESPDSPDAPTLKDSKDGLINTSTPTVTGTVEPNATVGVYLDRVFVGTVIAGTDGKWSYTFSPALVDGTYEVAATATDAAGNMSELGNATSVTVDTQKPVAPSTPHLETDNISGAVKINQPVISGSAEPNSTVSIYDGTDLVTTVTADASGNWTYTFTPALTDGEHNITTTATDAAGNTSDRGGDLKINVDTATPVTPSAPTLNGGHEGSINTSAPTIVGHTEPGTTVTIYNNGSPVATVIADGHGDWSHTFSPALADGEYTFTTTSTDNAGNTTDASEALKVTVDTQKPAEPSGNTLDHGRNGYINTATPTVSGIAEPGSTVTIYNNDIPVGTATAGTDGKWSYLFSPALTDGTYNISTTSTDKAGNISTQTPTFPMIVDTRTPATPMPPVMTGADSTGNIKTNVPSLSGNAEPGSVITIYDNGVPVGTVTAGSDGNWSYTFNPALSEGDHVITTTVTDPAGNTSAASAGYPTHVDTKIPSVYIVSGKYEANGPFSATITFSEAVKGFGQSDLLVENAKLSDFKQISATQYTVVVTPISDNGNITLQVSQAAAEDVSGNWNIASNMMKVAATFSGEVESVYPNPATSNLNIQFKGVTSTKGRVMLFKMSGQLVFDQQVTFQNNTLTVDVNKYAAGQYILVVKTNEYIHRTNIMIVR